MPVMKIRDVKPGEPFIEVESNDGSVALKVPKKDIEYNPVQVGDLINIEKIDDESGRIIPFKFKESDRADYIPEKDKESDLNKESARTQDNASGGKKFDPNKMSKLGFNLKPQKDISKNKANKQNKKEKKQSEKIEITDQDLLNNVKFHHTVLSFSVLFGGMGKVILLLINNQNLLFTGIINVLLAFSVLYGLVSIFNHLHNVHKFPFSVFFMTIISIIMLSLSVPLLSDKRSLIMAALGLLATGFSVLDVAQQKKITL